MNKYKVMIYNDVAQRTEENIIEADFFEVDDHGNLSLYLYFVTKQALESVKKIALYRKDVWLTVNELEGE